MKFEARFLSSFATIKSLPDDQRPEIALIGRSNVGKSSLINALTGKKQLAKTSSTPGKTRTLNYFSVNDTFYLVDMPGYGYAKQARSERMVWARIAESYFLERKELRSVGLLIDARHPELESDLMVLEWFIQNKLPLFIVLTKADKVRQDEIARHRRTLEEMLDGRAAVYVTSSEKGKGIAQLRKFIVETAN